MTSNSPSSRDIDRLIARISGTFVGVLLGLSPVWYGATGAGGMFIFNLVFLHFVVAFLASFFLYLFHPIGRDGWKVRGGAISSVGYGGYAGAIVLVTLPQGFPEPLPDFLLLLLVLGFLGMWLVIFGLGQWYARIRVVQAPD